MQCDDYVRSKPSAFSRLEKPNKLGAPVGSTRGNAYWSIQRLASWHEGVVESGRLFNRAIGNCL